MNTADKSHSACGYSVKTPDLSLKPMYPNICIVLEAVFWKEMELSAQSEIDRRVQRLDDT